MIRKFIFVVLVIVIFVCLFFGQSDIQNQAQEEIERINLYIRSQGLKWRADFTSLSTLPPEERRVRLGMGNPIHS